MLEGRDVLVPLDEECAARGLAHLRATEVDVLQRLGERDQPVGADLQAGRRSRRPNAIRLSRKLRDTSGARDQLGEDAAADRVDVFLRLEQHADRVVRGLDDRARRDRARPARRPSRCVSDTPGTL